jgi:hypothetical protein
MNHKKLVYLLLSVLLLTSLIFTVVTVRADTLSSGEPKDIIRIVLDEYKWLEDESKYEGYKIGQYILVNKTLYSSKGYNYSITDDRYDDLIQWQSSDDSILQFNVMDNGEGKFIVNGYGKVTITATIGNKSDSIIVDITRPADELLATEMNFTIKNGVLIKYRGDGGDVTIPDNVIEIGQAAFAKSNVTKVIMSNSVKYIGSSAFEYCKKLKSIKFSDNIENIDSFSFYHCTSLKEIKLPNKLKKLGGSAFFYCENLSKISFPDSVETIGNGCFLATKWLDVQQKKTTQVIVNGILIDATRCTGKVYISKNVKHINEGAFSGDAIKEVIIPSSVTSIGDYAFSSCNYLEKITIPKKLKTIGIDSFNNTKWLEKQQKKNPLVIVNGILIDGRASKGKVIIPKSVKHINDFAFSYSNIKEVIIPSEVESIGQSSFFRCGELEKLTISKNIKTIGESCFTDTKWLRKQQKNNSLVIVNGILIDGTTSKGDVIIPNSVKYINDSAFENCDDIKTVTMSNDVIGIGDRAFRSCDNLNLLILSDKISYMGREVFMWCISLKEVTIPSQLRKLPDLAFGDCNSLVKLEIPQNNILFGYNIFRDSTLRKDRLTLYGNIGSDVEKYANTYSIPFNSMLTDNVN